VTKAQEASCNEGNARNCGVCLGAAPEKTRKIVVADTGRVYSALKRHNRECERHIR